MNVLLVGNYMSDGQESMLRFSSMMEQGLASAGHQVEVCRPPQFFGCLSRTAAGAGRWLGYADKFLAFPPQLQRAACRADVVHICDHSNAFYVKHLQRRPHVVTCHDMIGVRGALNETPENRPRWTGKRLQHLILNGLKGAQHVACVSDATRADLIRLTHVPATRVSRIYNGLNYPYAPMSGAAAQDRLRELGVDPEQRFILHVGGNSWYKNRLGVLKIYAGLRDRMGGAVPKLVMAGQPWTAEMAEFARAAKINPHAFEILNSSSEDLRALYSLASVMLFPSLAEGFGWPIVEAQACGCIVVTSNRSPMSEIGGSAAVYVDPEDVEDAATAVRSVLQRVNCMREQNILNADRFNTSKMIQAYVEVYRQVLDERS